MLQTQRRDEWNKFLDSLDLTKNSMYKLYKELLHKLLITHPLLSPNSLTFSANEKVKLYADTYESQFQQNPGLNLPEVVAS